MHKSQSEQNIKCQTETVGLGEREFGEHYLKRRHILMVATVCGTCVMLYLFLSYVLPILIITPIDPTLIGIILTIVGFVEGLVFAIDDRRLKHKLAREALKKASLGVMVMGHHLIPNSELNEIDFGCSVANDDEVICIVPVSIVNTGELSAKNLDVRLSLPLYLSGKSLGNGFLSWKILGVYDIDDVRKKIWIKKGFKNVHFLFPELGPHQDYLVEMPISVNLSSATPSEHGENSDDAFPFDEKLLPPPDPQVYVQVSATDIERVNGQFYIRYFKAKNMEELTSEIQKDTDDALEKMLDDSQSPKDYMKNVIVIMPELKQVPKSKYGQQVKGTIYEGKYVETGFASLEIHMSRRDRIVRKSKLKTDPLLRGVVHTRKGNVTISKRRKLPKTDQV